MRFAGLLSILLAVASCTNRHSGDGGRDGAIKGESERSTVKVQRIDPEKVKRQIEAMRVEYAASMNREDRIFGETFEDVWWQRPSAKKMKRISTGQMFVSHDYNGGYPSFFKLLHGDQLLQGEYKRLYVDAHPYEPIFVVGPARVMTGTLRGNSRSWTRDELQLIASFFQTKSQILRKDWEESLRANGHSEAADAEERLPVWRVSVVTVH